ncbi:MAG: hypothetical protein OK439_04095 [Thaumarchaeota archaeon]|nr:hypothetical protein [Nitrososphaerota archaeon]
MSGLIMNQASDRGFRVSIFSLIVLLGLLTPFIFSGNLSQAQSSQNNPHARFSVLSPGQQATTDSPIRQFPIPTTNSGPNAIISAPNNTFWFVEFTGGKLGEFFANNETFKEFPIPENQSIPASLAIDHLGMIWFSDQSGKGSIWRFDPETRIFTQYKTLTAKSTPLFILIDDQNNVWFTETTQNRLGLMSYPNYTMGEYVLPSSNSGPVELAFGENQTTIWITETFTGKIASFNTILHSFTEYTPPSQDFLKSPVGIVADNQGNVWVSEHGGSAVVELTPSNSTFRKFPTSIPPPSVYPVSAVATIAIDSKGNLWFVEHFSNKVGRLDPSTNTIEEFQIPTSEPAYSVLNALDANGNFWFTEFGSNQIAEIPANTSSPIRIFIRSDKIAIVGSGTTVTSNVIVTNTLDVPLVITLNVSSSFSSTGETNSKEVSFNSTILNIPAGGTGTVIVSITPDSSLPSGSYSVGIIASSGNYSTIGITFITVQGQFSIVEWLTSNYQIVLVAIILVLGIAYFSIARNNPKMRRKVRS